VLSQMLAGLGCEVATAETGEQALELAASTRPDIVFLDIRLPGMDGLEVARRIRARRPQDKVPVTESSHSEPMNRSGLLTSAPAGGREGRPPGEGSLPKLVSFSASVLAHEQESYRAAGFDDSLGKPLRFERVCDCLARLLQVTFEYAEPKRPEAAPAGGTAGSLPPALAARLRDAVERFSLTRLEECFAELDKAGEPAAQLSAHLRALAEKGDLEAISRFLNQAGMP